MAIGSVTVVGAVAAYLVPQVMAYSAIVGVPPVAGLWTALAAMLVYAVMGGSRVLSVGPELYGVASGGPGAQVGDDGWCGAEHGDAGAERQGADAVWRQDRHAADGALVGAGAVVAEGHAVGVFVAFSDERGEVLEVAAVGCAAEDDLDDAGVPDRAGLVFAPPVASLCEGLQDRHCRDPGATAFGHERRQ